MKQLSLIDESDILEKEVREARNSLSTDRLDMSFGEIMSMYERDEIIIDPAFQRLYRWSDYQKTRFIESLLLGIPIPPIFVAEDENGKWELVDGLQRLSTVLSFCGYLKVKNKDENNWSMIAGDLVKNLLNKDFDELPLKFQLNIKRSTCRIEIIKWDSNYDMRYELFNRLNTGGSELTDQEIRNCIFRGVSDNFNIYLKEVSENENFLLLISPTDKQVSELYLQELVLRYSSLYNNAENVKNNISQHMTDFMRSVVEEKREFDYDVMKNKFFLTSKLLSTIGQNVFKARNAAFSSSLYDAIFVSVAENIEHYETLDIELIKKAIKELKINKEFQSLMGSSAASNTRVKKRHLIAKSIFNKLD